MRCPPRSARPAAALDMIDNGEADGLIVRDLDRLTREVTVQEAILGRVGWSVTPPCSPACRPRRSSATTPTTRCGRPCGDARRSSPGWSGTSASAATRRCVIAGSRRVNPSHSCAAAVRSAAVNAPSGSASSASSSAPIVAMRLATATEPIHRTLVRTTDKIVIDPERLRPAARPCRSAPSRRAAAPAGVGCRPSFPR